MENGNPNTDPAQAITFFDKIAEEYADVPNVIYEICNEPTSLLRKTLVGCLRMKYPDKSKVHIYLCDDNRRSEMRDLALELGVNYFDRPDNKDRFITERYHDIKAENPPRRVFCFL